MRKVTPDTIARTVCLGLALLNQVLAVLGKEVLPFAEDQVYQFVTLFFTILTAGIAWWKNNSFTRAAIATDQLMPIVKEQLEREGARCE